MLGVLLAGPPAFAADRALLIAASNYEVQPLQGPASDAALLYRVLLARGIDPAQIRLLADGLPRQEGDPTPDGPPTRQAILAAFDRLAAEARPGDWVFIAMSGHGTQAPARDPAAEPDGLDELFLPIDVGRWDQARGEVRNAIRDDEIGESLDRITSTGAFVWIVIDSCHSGSGTRNLGGAPLRARYLSPEALGIPTAAMQSGDGVESAPSMIRSRSDRLVAFYAAQPHEVAYEAALPTDQAEAESHGLLSFFLAQSLANRPDASYLEVAQAVRAGYDRFAAGVRNFPTPMFEGALERKVLGGAERSDDAWPAWRDRDDRLRIAAGSLQGLHLDDEISLYDVESDGERLATARVAGLGLVESEITTDEVAASVLPTQFLARSPVRRRWTPVRVSGPPRSSQLLGDVGERLRDSLPTGAGIELVEPSSPADLRVYATNRGVVLAAAQESVAEAIAGGAVQLSRDLGAQDIATRLAAEVVARAPAIRIQKLAADFVGTPAARDLSIELSLMRDPRRLEVADDTALDPARTCLRPAPEPPADAEILPPTTIPTLLHCDTLYVTLETRRRAVIDLGLFFIDSRGLATPLGGYASLRLEPSATKVTVPLTVTTWDWQKASPSTTGPERVVILAVRRTSKIDRAYQPDFATALGMADQGTPALSGSDANDPFLRLLGPDGGVGRRGVGRADPREEGFIEVIRWNTSRPYS